MSRIDTVKTEVFKFDELSKEAQQIALEKLYDLNVNYDWWESVYEDAGSIGLKITGFDIDRGSYCEGEFNLSPEEIAANVMRDHGETCETYTTANNFITDKNNTIQFDEDGDISNEDDLLDLESEFLKSLLEDYRIILSKEYEYLTSDEAIKETIEANDYEFTAEGKLY